jgi:hypothetical protein
LADYVAGHAEIAVNGENPLLHFVRGCDYERVFGTNGATAEAPLLCATDMGKFLKNYETK